MERKIDKSTVRPIACGGTGGDPVVVDSKDGKAVRIRPLHWDMRYTEEELAPSMWEFEARGKTLKCPMRAFPPYYALAYKKKVYSKDRVLYPLKRVDWEPGGDPDKINAQNRGRSQFKRISWDEALDILEGEIRRIHAEYGPTSVLCIGYNGHKETKAIHYGSGCHMMLLTMLGGYTREIRTPDSVEGFYWGAKHVWGLGAYGGLVVTEDYSNVIKDVSENTGLLVLQSGDLETTQNYSTQYWSYLMKYWQELGIDMVTIDPFGSYTTMIHDNIAWVPLLPNTDVAFDYGMIHLWLTEGLYDKEYVETHTVGIEKMIDYVMGKEDGIVKDAAWASEICGVPEWTIKAVARKWASCPTTMGHFCGAHIRGPYSHEPGRTEYYKLGMQGIGKPGVHQLHLFSFNVADQVIPTGDFGGYMTYDYFGHALTYDPTVTENPDAISTLPRTMIAHAIDKGELSWYGGPTITGATAEDQWVERHYPNEKNNGAKIHMIWSEKASNQASWNGGFYLQDMYRNPDIQTFVSNHQWLQCDTIFADLILPISTCLEEKDVAAFSQGCSLLGFGCQDKAIDTVGESMSDYEICIELAERFGIKEMFTKGLTVEEEMYASWAASPVSNFISWEDFSEKQYWIPPMREDWKEIPSGKYNFYKDPENYPLSTPTGKIQFYAPELDEHFPEDKERQSIAKWIVGGTEEEGFLHDETQFGEKAKTYPLLLNTSPGRWRVHVQNDDITWLREIPTCKIIGKDGYAYEPVWMCPELAEARGIAEGDIVKVFNNEGIVLGAAHISERVMPNSVKMDKGAHPDPIGPHIDRGGCTNLISPRNVISKHCPGFVVTGYLVDVAKLEDAEMEQWKKDYPEHFEREYDPISGSSRAGWVVEG